MDEAAAISVIALNAVKRKLILEQINKRGHKRKGWITEGKERVNDSYKIETSQEKCNERVWVSVWINE